MIITGFLIKQSKQYSHSRIFHYIQFLRACSMCTVLLVTDWARWLESSRTLNEVRFSTRVVSLGRGCSSRPHLVKTANSIVISQTWSISPNLSIHVSQASAVFDVIAPATLGTWACPDLPISV